MDNDKILLPEPEDDIDTFDDEIDCAIMNDPILITARKSVFHEDEDTETVDTKVEYSDSANEPTEEDIDASEIIDAEREIEFDPTGEDELLDIAINGDEDVDLSDDEEQIDEEE